MATPRERILVVESKREISDLITRQSLLPLGYKVDVLTSVPAAIQASAQSQPDLIIANLNLPGLSGKDLLVALGSQGLEIPLVVLSEEGAESEIIQAFRLGAADFLLWPAREAEVVSVVERVLQQGRARRDREALVRQLNKANQELQRRVRELTTLTAIGKAVTSITDHQRLFERLVEGSVFIADADCGWLLLREGQGKVFNLVAQRNLPEPLASRLNQPWDDGIGSLVAVSGEPLAIHGEPIKRFKISRLGLSALVMPVKVQHEVLGLLTVVRKGAVPFGPDSQGILSAVSDYASISLMNARLFRALEERAQRLQRAVEATQEHP
jgi:two-component system NtrC family sensor kinase